MAGETRMIQVTGLPVGGSENRLIDKLQIHFLRKKNGGGEITSVTVSKTMPGTAFITFEDSEVASRLAQRGKQVFKANDKSYDISISLHHEEVDVEKVLLCMSVVVDHRMLPGGKNTLLFLHKNFPGVDLIFDDQKDHCTLKGSYTEVQSLSSLLLESLDKQDQSSGDKPQSETKTKKMYHSPLEESANSHSGENEDTGEVKHTMLDEDQESKSWKTGLSLPGGYSSHASHAPLMEDKWDSAPDTGTLFEDFSLIVDSDIFRYLNEYCSKEYQSILQRHGVEVLDVNCDDITILYLKPKTSLPEHGISSVTNAHRDLAHLHQQKESQLRKEQVYKHGIPKKELSQALESLRKRLPKLMINEENSNVYMVGSKSDVSEAKQVIGEMQGFGMKKEIHLDHRFGPSQSKFTFSKQGSAASSESSRALPSFQDSDDLFMSKKDLQNANQRGIPSENASKRGDNSVEPKNIYEHSATGKFPLSSQRIKEPTEDIFSLRKIEVSQEIPHQSDQQWMKPGTEKAFDRNKCTDGLFDSSKPSASYSILDINEKLFNKSDLTSQTAEFQSNLGTRLVGSESQIMSNKGYKAKQTDPGKERKMAANFSGEMSSGFKDLTSYKSDALVLLEGTYVKERKFLDSGQPRSLPLIKPSMNNNLDPNTSGGRTSAKNSTSKMDSQELKGDMSKHGHFPYDKKSTVNPACLSGDQGVKCFSTMPSGSPLKCSNSFSGKNKKGEATTPVAVDLSAGQMGLSKKNQTLEIVAMDLVLSIKLWLYLSSIYNTEIENLTSDLQVKERMGKEDITLCLRGINSEKVGECYHGLKTLIASAEMDFDTRTLPLTKLRVSDSKDKTLLEVCTLMMQRYKMVKILIVSKDMMILGPKTLCDETEATIINFFHTGGNTANLKLENKTFPNSDSLHTSKTPESDLKLLGEQSRTSAKTHNDIIMKDLSGQNVACSLKTVPQVLTNQTNDGREQDNESGSRNKMNEENLDQLDKKDPTLMEDDGGTMIKEKGETSSGSIINPATKDEADDEDNRNHTSTTASSKGTFTEQMSSGISLDQMSGNSQGSEPKTDTPPSHTSRNQNLLLCYVCEKEHSAVKQTGCGYRFCPNCDREVHNNCKICATSGIKGTMSIQESTITISGYNRDTTLKIIYDIPDGIQGEDHPCPGAHFKGNRFEAFLPNNKASRKLLPLLEKAFHKGLTFTVKVGASGDEGKVVWGSIPHKTRTEGGASNKGYPDFRYIKQLEDVLKAAGIEE